MIGRALGNCETAPQSAWIGLLLLATTVLGGCRPATGIVTGSVSFEGRPIDMGVVTFMGPTGEVVSGSIDRGRYEAAGVPVGQVSVAILSVSPPVDMVDRSAAFVPLPDRYTDPEHSGLSLTVAAGRQEQDFSLTAKPQ